jgi:two-component system sensor histidine kinase RegB
MLAPLILCAVSLGVTLAWIMTAWVGLLYSLLAWFYHPLRLGLPEEAAVNLHLAGMWLNFLLTAVLVAAFVARLAATLREREATLADIREKALRDEHLFALGMQAAAAAHDLATPLASLRLTLQELAENYAGDDELDPSLRQLSGQADRMKTVLGRLAIAAGAARSPHSGTRLADEWLSEVLNHWRLMRPQAVAALNLPDRPPPAIREEPILVSVLATLLNNAADASPDEILLAADWDADTLTLSVSDSGPGLSPGAHKETGWGVGLTLAKAALERFDGTLAMSARHGGGLSVTLTLPIAKIRA